VTIARWVPHNRNSAPVRAQVMAHRGASAAERENTTVAFTRARELHSDGVELDVRLCASGEMIVHHNPTLANGKVLSTLNIADIPDHIPTLADALDACAGMWVNIEIKNDPSEPDFDPEDKLATLVVDFLRTRGVPDQWLISSFRRETIDAVHRLWPELPTAWLDMVVADDAADALAKDLLNSGHQAYHPYVKTLTRSVVDTMHRNGVAVNTWTCDDPTRMAELVSWGIDGICTNVPDVALGVIANAK